MPTTSEIGGAFGINPDSSRQGAGTYYYRQKPKNPNLRKLKSGEIVQGLIIERVDEFVAEVRLPNGTYKAEISGRLRKGDTIFFKVQSVAPSLVLTIYAATTRTPTKQQPVEELIRMLDIPDNEIYRELINFLVKYYNILLKDQVKNFAKSLALLKPDELKGKYQNSVLTAMLFILEAELNPSVDNNFRLIYPLFDDLNKFNRKFSNVRNYLLRTKYLGNNNLLKPTPDFSEIISVFSKPSNDSEQESFYNKLKFIKNIENLDSSITTDSTELINLIDSRNFWNATAVQRELPKFLILPLIFGDRTELIRIGLIKSNKSMSGAGNTNLSFDNNSGKISLGLKYPSGYTTVITLEDVDYEVNYLNDYLTGFIEYLTISNYRVIYFDCTISPELKMSIENFEKHSGLQSHGFSVVI